MIRPAPRSKDVPRAAGGGRGGVRRSVLAFALVVLSANTASGLVWPTDVSRAEAALASSDVEARRHAARQLLALPPRVVARLGLPLLSDQDASVRLTAVEALLVARVPGLGRRVEQWLSDPDERVRRAAARVLAWDPVPQAVPALGRILSDPDASVRIAAAKALGATASREASASLLGRLDDPDPDARVAVVRALSRLRDPGAVVPLVGKLQDPRTPVRVAVIQALGNLGDARAATALSLSLRDSDEAVRVASLASLATLGATSAVPAITSLLSDERRPAVQRAALAALGVIPAEEGLDALMSALAEDEPGEESPVRAALLLSGGRAQARLEACLSQEARGALGDGCALTLGEMGAKGAARTITAALRRGAVRPLAALRALAAAGDREGLSAVLEQLGSSDPWVRSAARQAAAALLDPAEPDGRPVDALERALDAAHGRTGELAEIVSLLGRTGSSRAASALLPLARHSTDANLRLAAVRALGLIGPAAQDTVLLEALDEPDGALRLAAGVALARTATSGTAERLLDRLALSVDQDREAVAVALSGALARGTPAAHRRAGALLSEVAGPAFDALTEALGRVTGAAGSTPLLSRLRSERDPASKAKIAEALAGHPEAAPALLQLLSDRSPRVRANAAWSLGHVVEASAQHALLSAVDDVDVAVAANAATSYGRVAARAQVGAAAACDHLVDARPAVRMGILRAILESNAPCPVNSLIEVLLRDPSEAVRAAAVPVLGGRLHDAKDGPPVVAALSSCKADDASSRVAAACTATARGPHPSPNFGRGGPVSIYVVPNGGSEPMPGAPFGLVLPDGRVRFGTADRRGTVFEGAAAEGVLRLTLPAAILP